MRPDVWSRIREPEVIVNNLQRLVDLEFSTEADFRDAFTRYLNSDDEIKELADLIVDHATTSLYCHPFEGTDRFGRYLGFHCCPVV